MEIGDTGQRVARYAIGVGAPVLMVAGTAALLGGVESTALAATTMLAWCASSVGVICRWAEQSG